jgi:hypothetical protein
MGRRSRQPIYFREWIIADDKQANDAYNGFFNALSGAVSEAVSNLECGGRAQRRHRFSVVLGVIVRPEEKRCRRLVPLYQNPVPRFGAGPARLGHRTPNWAYALQVSTHCLRRGRQFGVRWQSVAATPLFSVQRDRGVLLPPHGTPSCAGVA